MLATHLPKYLVYIRNIPGIYLWCSQSIHQNYIFLFYNRCFNRFYSWSIRNAFFDVFVLILFLFVECGNVVIILPVPLQVTMNALFKNVYMQSMRKSSSFNCDRAFRILEFLFRQYAYLYCMSCCFNIRIVSILILCCIFILI